MSFDSQSALAKDPAYRAKVRQAVIYAAMDIMGEAKAGGMSDAKFGKRQALAQDIIRTGGAGYEEAFSWLVSVFNGGIVQGNSGDQDFQFAVNSLFDDVAGVRSTD